MTLTENVSAILHEKPYDYMPVVSFGFWNETLQKCGEEEHITNEEAQG